MTENLFLQDQAVSFHRPYPASLTALHEKQPEQGIFYRQDGTPFLKLWMKKCLRRKDRHRTGYLYPAGGGAQSLGGEAAAGTWLLLCCTVCG